VLRKILSLSALAAFLCAGAAITQEKETFTADRHKELGMGCESCHEDAQPKAAPAEPGKACAACHGPMEEVAKKTGELFPNPHDNHITQANEVDCTECHKGHKADATPCQNCHVGMKFVKTPQEQSK